MDWRLVVTAALLAGDWLIRLGLSVRVIMLRREVSASLAWLSIIFFVPILGGFVYLLVGENRLGAERAARLERISKAMGAQGAALWRQRSGWGSSAPGYEQIARLGAAQTHLPPSRGNEILLLSRSERVLEAMCADIDRAEHHCHVLTYIWQLGGGPDRVVEALERAAGRGVECRVLADSYGAKAFFRDSRARRLREAGVEVVEALPASPVRMLFRRLDLRNHRKLVVIDGRVAYTGLRGRAGARRRALALAIAFARARACLLARLRA